MNRIVMILFVFLLANKAQTQSYYTMNSEARKAFSKIAAFQFDDANKEILEIRKKDPNNLITWWLENNIDFLTLLNSDDKVEYKKVYDQKSRRLIQLEKGETDSPWHRYCIADVYLQWAFCEGKYGDYLTAMNGIRKAHNLLLENQKLHPDFPPNLVGLGVIHTLIGSIPDDLQWIRKLLGYKGSVEQGITELQRVYNLSLINADYSFLEQQSLFFLSFLTVVLNTDKDKADAIINQYLFTRNLKIDKLEPLQAYALSRLCMYVGRNDDAIRMIQSHQGGQVPIFYFDYMLGNAYLNRLSDSSLIYFKRYIKNYKGNFYVKSAYQKMAWYHLLSGSETQYRQTISKIATLPDSKNDPDQTAEKEFKNGVAPNVLLLKARLLSDGGYYEKALKLMLSTRSEECCSEPRNSVEYSYRLGRIYEETGRTGAALDQYKITYSKGKDLPYYFSANACLRIGALYEQAGNFSLAETWYNHCLSLSFTEYRKSIRYKAELKLKELKKSQKKSG